MTEPKQNPRFSLFMQLSPKTSRPYRIVENVQTCDGIRSRLVSLSFSNIEDATKRLLTLENPDAPG